MCKLKIYLAVLFTVFIPPYAIAMDCPSIPAFPAKTAADISFQNSWRGVAEPASIRYTVRSDEQAPYGIGYLRLLTDQLYDWPLKITLPLWNSPDENSFYGWIYSGRVYPNADDHPSVLSGSGMVETGYEHTSFIVWETATGGWVRIRVKPGQSSDVWTHQCHLKIGKAKLAFEQWEAFLRRHGEWLHFRANVLHSLRERPDANSPRVTKIGLDHKLILREIEGDWMRVKVQQPDWTCMGEPEEEFKGTTHEGWVKWRDEITGPWVWVYTRGC